MARFRRFQDSKLVQLLLGLLALFFTVDFAVGIYRHWHDADFRLGVSIVGVALFGFCAYSSAHYLVTGRHLSDRFSRSAR